MFFLYILLPTSCWFAIWEQGSGCCKSCHPSCSISAVMLSIIPMTSDGRKAAMSGGVSSLGLTQILGADTRATHGRVSKWGALLHFSKHLCRGKSSAVFASAFCQTLSRSFLQLPPRHSDLVVWQLRGSFPLSLSKN